MYTNSELPPAINQWQLSFDPYDFANNPAWLRHAEKCEDILQLTHKKGGLLIDVGYYGSDYRAVVIRDYNWQQPLAELTSHDVSVITQVVYQWLTQFAEA
ncbi:hypothetical protein L9G74_04380 [Shewanella sp. C32]|uniref:Uncharacterized protein n=1 Tax=Shewanella electrica TaxID=515560 RepID=A0ABT2FK88_9GAMM|nr:hypothetical protein [Shewanella electrica]MCH1923568.1 hypothetical protein [Shewanella electrica]MCS4555664.1 hypothetical protein [Shewanella electrica]